jgi:hypothetical protein
MTPEQLMMQAMLQNQQLMIDQSLITHKMELKGAFHSALVSYKSVISRLKASTILTLPDHEIQDIKQARCSSHVLPLCRQHRRTTAFGSCFTRQSSLDPVIRLAAADSVRAVHQGLRGMPHSSSERPINNAGYCRAAHHGCDDNYRDCGVGARGWRSGQDTASLNGPVRGHTLQLNVCRYQGRRLIRQST